MAWVRPGAGVACRSRGRCSGVAKGMIAERLDLGMEQSFATLRNHARNHNLRLGDVVESVINGSLLATQLDAGPR
jgi:hypothetical protein